ncbi:MAG: DUF3108 domain-containing protein [Cocleimonas sp.]
MFKLMLTAFLMLFAQHAMALPKAFQANYAVSKGSLSLGNLHATLKYSGNQYHYHKYTKATGLAAVLTGIKITENTDGIFSGENMTPQNYLFNQSRRKKSRIDKATFTTGKVTGSYKNKAYKLAISPNTQDRASLELVLARDLAKNKTDLNYHVVERGKLKKYTFQKLGYQKVKTSAGEFNAMKVKVVRDQNSKRETIFWLAKEVDFLPVKIRHTEKGNVITTIIKDYKRI